VERFSVRVNGTTHELTADADTPLLYLLRNDVGLTGPKLGCGLAQWQRDSLMRYPGFGCLGSRSHYQESGYAWHHSHLYAYALF
jgi:hypothetical protein